MCSLQPCDELGFANATGTAPQDQIHELIPPYPSFSEGKSISFSATRSNDNVRSPRGRRSTDQSSRESNDRRVLHREIERRRRQQMSKLYLSLRHLLPNKGRSSVCDQMEEAERYIRQMHNNIKELRNRRDDLKKYWENWCWSRGKNNININIIERSKVCSDDKYCVAINQVVGDGHGVVEILIQTPGFELSPVLAELMRTELDLVASVSTRSNAGFLHKFQIQVRDMASLDVAELHDRLVEAIKSSGPTTRNS